MKQESVMSWTLVQTHCTYTWNRCSSISNNDKHTITRDVIRAPKKNTWIFRLMTGKLNDEIITLLISKRQVHVQRVEFCLWCHNQAIYSLCIATGKVIQLWWVLGSKVLRRFFITGKLLSTEPVGHLWDKKFATRNGYFKTVYLVWISAWGTGMAQRWEHSPPIIVAQVAFQPGAICMLSLLLVLDLVWFFFLRVLGQDQEGPRENQLSRWRGLLSKCCNLRQQEFDIN